MYLHLGQGIMVPQNDIIGIFDLDCCSRSKKTRDFLNAAEKAQKIVVVGDDIPKSFTIVSKKGESFVYLSQISAATLYKRSKSISFE